MSRTFHRDQFLNEEMAKYAGLLTPDQELELRESLQNTTAYSFTSLQDEWEGLEMTLRSTWWGRLMWDVTPLVFGLLRRS